MFHINVNTLAIIYLKRTFLKSAQTRCAFAATKCRSASIRRCSILPNFNHTTALRNVRSETGHQISRLTARLWHPQNFWPAWRATVCGDARILAGQGKSRPTHDQLCALSAGWQAHRSWVAASTPSRPPPHARLCLPDRCCALNERNYCGRRRGLWSGRPAHTDAFDFVSRALNCRVL